MSDRATTKQQVQGRDLSSSNTTVSAEVDKVIIGCIVAFTSVVGLWVTACLSVAMYQSGGPLQLFYSWFNAVTGL